MERSIDCILAWPWKDQIDCINKMIWKYLWRWLVWWEHQRFSRMKAIKCTRKFPVFTRPYLVEYLHQTTRIRIGNCRILIVVICWTSCNLHVLPKTSLFKHTNCRIIILKYIELCKILTVHKLKVLGCRCTYNIQQDPVQQLIKILLSSVDSISERLGG